MLEFCISTSVFFSELLILILQKKIGYIIWLLIGVKMKNRFGMKKLLNLAITKFAKPKIPKNAIGLKRGSTIEVFYRGRALMVLKKFFWPKTPKNMSKSQIRA